MTIAELFVNLGIKGSEKTLDTLGKAKKGMGDLKDLSFEAKAGIVAAMYALERLFATSGKVGTGLTNFTALLNVSSKTLQEYQYAARQMGASNEDAAASFKTLQSAMAKTLMGEAPPKGMGRVAMFLGGFDRHEVKKFEENPELLMQKLQKYALLEKNAGIRNEVLKSFGLSEGMISAMARNAFNPGALKRAPTYSNNEIGQLDKANIAWANLGTTIEMAVGHFNAKHGMQLVNDISQIVGQIVKLTESFVTLAEKVKIFQLIGKVFEGWGYIFEGLNSTLDTLTNMDTFKSTEEPGKGGVGQWLKEAAGNDWNSFKNTVSNGAQSIGDAIAPPVGPMGNPGGSNTTNVTQTLNFQHDGKDAKKTGDSVKEAVKRSYFQMATQGQGS